MATYQSCEQVLRQHGFDAWIPELLTPGGLALISPAAISDEFKAFEDNPKVRFWYVRGGLAEQQPPSCLQSIAKRLLTKPTSPSFFSTVGSRLYVGQLRFEVFANADNDVTEFGLQVEAPTPSVAIQRSREPFADFLDELSASTYVPLQFQQFSVSTERDAAAMAFEVHIPFDTKLGFEEGTLQFPPINHLFSYANALFREALSSENPYYRLLCAFRLRDAIMSIRTTFGKISAAKKVPDRIPKLPIIAMDEIFRRGATIREEGRLQQIRLNELFDAWTWKRNAVAHFNIDVNDRKHVLVPSIGSDYRDFSCSAAILLFYAHNALHALRTFSIENADATTFAIVVDFPSDGDLSHFGALRLEPSRYGVMRMSKSIDPNSNGPV